METPWNATVIIRQTSIHLPNGRFEVSVLLKDSVRRQSGSFEQAARQFFSLGRKLANKRNLNNTYK